MFHCAPDAIAASQLLETACWDVIQPVLDDFPCLYCPSVHAAVYLEMGIPQRIIISSNQIIAISISVCVLNDTSIRFSDKLFPVTCSINTGVAITLCFISYVDG